jgi:hypothetical protein
MSKLNPGVTPTPTPGTTSQSEIDQVRGAWAQDTQEVGLGLYNPFTGEIHVGTFDTTGQRMGQKSNQ